MILRQITVSERADGRCDVMLSGTPLSPTEARELEYQFERLADRQRDVRVVVVSSRGPDFCPGPAEDLDPLFGGTDPVAALAAISVPVVAALHGTVDSVGLELALAADLRVARDDTTFSMTDLAAGRFPCWGGTQRLPRSVGAGLATLMLLTGRRVDVTQAETHGLVHVRGDQAAVNDVVAQLEALAPLALAAAKEAIARGAELTLRQALELEGDMNHLLQTTSDRAEGLSAFFDKRAPRFSGA